MTRYHHTFVAGLAALAVAVTATQAPASAPPAETADRALSCVHVFGIDRSGSYNFVRLGLKEAARLVVLAPGGCRIVVRWIAEASYTDAEFVESWTAPPAFVSECENPFDRRCRAKVEADRERNVQARRTAMTRIQALQPETSNYTDINGFIQAASDIFSTASPGAELYLYLATDLEDNRRRHVEPDLRGALVTVLALQSAVDPKKTIDLRKNWEKRLRDWGASEVRFQTASESR
jgi:hypothetical protein